MSNDLVVGAVIALMVIASVSYLVYQRRKGISSCGCKGCKGHQQLRLQGMQPLQGIRIQRDHRRGRLRPLQEELKPRSNRGSDPPTYFL